MYNLESYSECDSSYKTKKGLNKHIASIHEGKKRKFPCTICDAIFELKSKRTLHLETVHPETKKSV